MEVTNSHEQSANKDGTESRKRQLSDNVEPTGVSPEAKKPVMVDRMSLKMPDDDALPLDWFKALFAQMETMCEHYAEFKQSLEFNQNELADCKKMVSTMSKETCALKTELSFLKCENQDLKVQYTALAEKQIKTEIHLREKNLIF